MCLRNLGRTYGECCSRFLQANCNTTQAITPQTALNQTVVTEMLTMSNIISPLHSMMISTCKLSTTERLTFFLHRLQWNRFPTGSGIQSHLFKICTRQFLQNAPDVLVNLEAFKKCRFTVTTKHSEAVSMHSISVCKIHKWLSSSKRFSESTCTLLPGE